MKNDQLETMLTARQVADFLQVSISTVRRWSDKGLLKFYRVGSRGDRRYRRKDVLRFLDESSRQTPTERTKTKKPTPATKGKSPAARTKRNTGKTVRTK